jgi:AmmeMemoRadiSam system protein A
VERSEKMGTRGPQPMKTALSNSLSAVFGCGLFLLALATWAGNPVLCAEKVGSKGPTKGGDMTDKDQLTTEEGQYLLSVARQTIEEALFQNMNEPAEDSGFSPKFSERRGTFVTLTTGGQLRGCIGHIIPQESLIEGVKTNAINAAFRDPRFKPLAREEFNKIQIEVSILTEPKPLPYRDEEDLLMKLRPGVDGLIIQKGGRQATFLPQVWEQLPDKKEFLTHLCLKAGLDADEWKRGELRVSTYQVQAFEEE